MKYTYITIIFSCLVSCQSYWCDQYRSYFFPKIAGKVVDKKIGMQNGRYYITVQILNYTDSLFVIEYLSEGNLTHMFEKGDSVYKKRESLIFNYYRREKLYAKTNLGYDCNTDPKERFERNFYKDPESP